MSARVLKRLLIGCHRIGIYVRDCPWARDVHVCLHAARMAPENVSASNVLSIFQYFIVRVYYALVRTTASAT